MRSRQGVSLLLAMWAVEPTASTQHQQEGRADVWDVWALGYSFEGGEAFSSLASGAVSGTSSIVIVGILFPGWSLIVSLNMRWCSSDCC